MLVTPEVESPTLQWERAPRAARAASESISSNTWEWRCWWTLWTSWSSQSRRMSCCCCHSFSLVSINKTTLLLLVLSLVGKQPTAMTSHWNNNYSSLTNDGYDWLNVHCHVQIEIFRENIQFPTSPASSPACHVTHVVLSALPVASLVTSLYADIWLVDSWGHQVCRKWWRHNLLLLRTEKWRSTVA